jgi:hypothetical protein
MEAKDRYRKTALHYAAEEGHSSVVKLLLLAGADKEAKDRFGDTPLHYAREKGHAAVVEALERAEGGSATIRMVKGEENMNLIPEQCSTHPQSPALSNCNGCSRPLCGDCLRVQVFKSGFLGGSSVHFYCSDCLPTGERPDAGTLGFLQRAEEKRRNLKK